MIAARGRVEELERLLDVREGAAGEATRALANEVEDLHAELARVRTSIDKANKSNLSLQADAARASSELAEIKARTTARGAAAEETMASLQASSRALSAQLEAANEDRSRLSAEVEAARAAIARLEGSAAAAVADAAAATNSAGAAAAASKRELEMLGERYTKLEKQLGQTQALLAVVQEQRRSLQDNNAQLREAMEGDAKRRLGEPNAPPS